MQIQQLLAIYSLSALVSGAPFTLVERSEALLDNLPIQEPNLEKRAPYSVVPVNGGAPLSAPPAATVTIIETVADDATSIATVTVTQVPSPVFTTVTITQEASLVVTVIPLPLIETVVFTSVLTESPPRGTIFLTTTHIVQPTQPVAPVQTLVVTQPVTEVVTSVIKPTSSVRSKSEKSTKSYDDGMWHPKPTSNASSSSTVTYDDGMWHTSYFAPSATSTESATTATPSKKSSAASLATSSAISSVTSSATSSETPSATPSATSSETPSPTWTQIAPSDLTSSSISTTTQVPGAAAPTGQRLASRDSRMEGLDPNWSPRNQKFEGAMRYAH